MRGEKIANAQWGQVRKSISSLKILISDLKIMISGIRIPISSLKISLSISEYFGDKLGQFYPPFEGVQEFSTARGAEISSSVLGQTRVDALYSCPNLVVAKMEELISRPFVGLYKIRLLLRDRKRTKNFRFYLALLQLQLCLQLQQNTMVSVDVDGQICHFCSQGFVSGNKSL